MNITQEIKDIFGYDRSKLGWYRDFALGVTSGLSLILGAIFALEIYYGRGSSFDSKICLGCLVVSALCILVSPNKSTVLIGTITTLAAFALLRFMTTGNLKPLVVFLGLMMLLALIGGITGFVQWRRRREKSAASI